MAAHAAIPGPPPMLMLSNAPASADIEEMAYLGQTTNNVAEYTGLVKALEHARELGGTKLPSTATAS